MINTFNIAKIIFNIVIYHYGLLGLVITNSNFFFYLKTWYCNNTFQMINAGILLYFIYKTSSFTKKLHNTLRAYLQIFTLYNI